MIAGSPSIAMRDLEIRGAGNLLGTQQSGHIAAVGYEFYCQLLENAVRHLKQLPRRLAIEVDIDLLRPNRFQPRTTMDDSRIEELSKSIRSNGVISLSRAAVCAVTPMNAVFPTICSIA